MSPVEAPEHEEPASAEREAVVLLHGLGRTPVSMLWLGRRLAKLGFEIRTFGYVAASGETIDAMAARLKRAILERVEARRYHLVGHSLGGIIIRAGFRTPWPPELGRVVMLAPPNQPPQLARMVGDNALFRVLTGRAGASLADEAFYADLPRPTVEFGVIAGTSGQKMTFDEPNDGIVSVAGTRLEGMADFLEVPRVHTFIMNAPEVAMATAAFLRCGRFGELGRAEAGRAEPV